MLLVRSLECFGKKIANASGIIEPGLVDLHIRLENAADRDVAVAVRREFLHRLAAFRDRHLEVAAEPTGTDE
jgi:hypothetical protein